VQRGRWWKHGAQRAQRRRQTHLTEAHRRLPPVRGKESALWRACVLACVHVRACQRVPMREFVHACVLCGCLRSRTSEKYVNAPSASGWSARRVSTSCVSASSDTNDERSCAQSDVIDVINCRSAHFGERMAAAGSLLPLRTARPSLATAQRPYLGADRRCAAQRREAEILLSDRLGLHSSSRDAVRRRRGNRTALGGPTKG
jgi:hypothetical protein